MDNKKLEHLDENYRVQILERIEGLKAAGNTEHAEKIRMFYEEFPVASKFMNDCSLVCA